MAGKKGMKQYPPAIKAEVVERHREGESVNAPPLFSSGKNALLIRYAPIIFTSIICADCAPKSARSTNQKYIHRDLQNIK